MLSPVVAIACGLLLGCMLMLQANTLPNMLWLIGLSVLGLLIWLSLGYFAHKRLQQVVVVLLTACLGAVMVTWHGQQWLTSKLPSDLAGQDFWVVGTVQSLPAADVARSQFDLHVDGCRASDAEIMLLCQTHVAERTIRLSWYDAPTIHADMSLALQVRLRPPHGFANPGGMDFEQWLLQERVHATGYVRDFQLADDNMSQTLTSWSLLSIRERIRERMQHVLQDRPYAGILIALAIGDRSSISTEQWQVVQRTGIAHLLAISGLHIGGLALVVFLLSKRFWRLSSSLCRFIAAPRAAVIFASIAAFSYAALAGFTLPTQRALIMWLVIAVCLWLRRRPSLVVGFSIALILVLLLDPMAPLSAGFWLSFGVVAALLYGLSYRSNVHKATLRTSANESLWLRGVHFSKARLWRYLSWGWRTPLLAAIASLPMTKLWFGQVAWLTPLVNLLYVPLFSFIIVPLVLVSLPLLGAGEWGSQLASYSLLAAHELLTWLWQPLQLIADWPHAVNTGFGLSAAVLPDTWWVVLTTFLAVFGVLLLLSPLPITLRSLGLLLCLPLLWPPSDPLAEGSMQVSVLDVGQGLAVVVQTANHALVYDTGPSFRSDSDAAQHTLLPFLRHFGVDHVDRLVVSHGDSDHSGGVQSLLRDYSVTDSLAGEPQRLKMQLQSTMAALPVMQCHAGQRWQWDGVIFNIVHPQLRHAMNSHSTSSNNTSCVLHIQSQDYTVLLTGDIEREAELEILSQLAWSELKADVVVLPHHGSNSSSTYRFIQTVQAKTAIAAAGLHNRWGFPKNDVVQRWQQAGSQVLTTGQRGAILLDAKGRLTTWRAARKRFWHDAVE